jgi:hypothetical protein
MNIMMKPYYNKHPSERRKGGKKERTIIQPKDNTQKCKCTNERCKIKIKIGSHQRIPPFVFDTPKTVKITT